VLFGVERLDIRSDVQAHRQIEAAGKAGSFVVADVGFGEHLPTNILRFDQIGIDKLECRCVVAASP